MELAASWKPFRKSNSSARPITTRTRVGSIRRSSP
jgi:hypothetical protein